MKPGKKKQDALDRRQRDHRLTLGNLQGMKPPKNGDWSTAYHKPGSMNRKNK